ncbi:MULTISPECIES: NUDIX domain-containing protein [unclassified Fusibacter]|uniref:NUDIX hydrolase n=1 Tax=unclassified Fusibacter TaxID=2624464 RepID=UPI001010BF16|nr:MULTISPECIES: NUDIX domain-containing protein [unclassified Fusibacter]MCK8060796.1 NUDIX domain-containing protein [Fusibacter sp. A2]NPE23092.1 NUDIX domain-containing protein [Fusibacter sp. A1]RXV59762.1 NUDIX hydrolase [Fusibacter sp. A1]
MKIHFRPLGTFKTNGYLYAVTVAFKGDKLVLVHHKDRNTYELPGGTREPGEDINDTGSRELIEESGAKDFIIEPFCDYGVERDGEISTGRLFKAQISTFDEQLQHEMEQVSLFDELPPNLTYPEIITALVNTVKTIQNTENIHITTSQEV